MNSPSRLLRSASTLIAGLLLPFGIDVETSDDPAQLEAKATQEAALEGANAAGYASGDRWQRHAVCADWITVELTGEMFGGTWEGTIPDCAEELQVYADMCGDGEVPLAPWWVSRGKADGTYGPWSQASQYQCGTDLLLAQVERAWATMPIAPNTYVTQPSAGFAIAELGVNLVVDTNPRTLDVTLMGTPVTIRAVATQYT